MIWLTEKAPIEVFHAENAHTYLYAYIPEGLRVFNVRRWSNVIRYSFHSTLQLQADQSGLRDNSVRKAERVSFLTKTEGIQIGERVFHIRSLLNASQAPNSPLADETEDSNASVNLTNWPLFGLVWPSGIILAELIDEMELTGLRVCEVGCGLALAGIVAHSKGADVIVSDFNPHAAEFLEHNIALNGLPPLRYIEANWCETYPDLGRFDLIIGGDVLYDRDHPRLLAHFLQQHLKPKSRVIISDPGRQNYRQFTKEMAAIGFQCSTTMKKLNLPVDDKAQCRILDYQRDAEGVF